MEYLFNFDKLNYLRGEHRSGSCVLCMVAEGSSAVQRLIVRETPGFLVSLNLYPYNPGHLIIFPRRHILDVRAFKETERTELDRVVDAALNALDSVMAPVGYNIGYNMGPAAGASIEHIHLHIIPRYEHEIGIVELIGGSRVLVQDPKETLKRLAAVFPEIS